MKADPIAGAPMDPGALGNLQGRAKALRDITMHDVKRIRWNRELRRPDTFHLRAVAGPSSPATAAAPTR